MRKFDWEGNTRHPELRELTGEPRAALADHPHGLVVERHVLQRGDPGLFSHQVHRERQAHPPIVIGKLLGHDGVAEAEPAMPKLLENVREMITLGNSSSRFASE